MPGRVSTRNPAASRTSNKSSAATLKSKSSATLVPEEGPTTDLRIKICAIFGEAQKSAAGHRKLVVSLRKIHETCCYEPQKPGKDSLDGFDENDFNAEIARCMIRILTVKKTEGAGDRILKFFGQFLKHASEKEAEFKTG
ncbi:MAG: hypothetical protein LQ340_003537 [Diploschistes diacapsis]|nr:MAG: hypothetical protein LQ340_003537 [Diploschistes diacapsis]